MDHVDQQYRENRPYKRMWKELTYFNYKKFSCLFKEPQKDYNEVLYS